VFNNFNSSSSWRHQFFFIFLLLDLQLGFLGVNSSGSSLSALLATNFPAVLICARALALYTTFGSFAATGARLSGTCLNLSRAVLVATRRSRLVPFWSPRRHPQHPIQVIKPHPSRLGCIFRCVLNTTSPFLVSATLELLVL